MLRSAQRLVLPQAGLLQQACLYSTQVDYNDLVIKGTSDLKKVDPVPDKEIGMCAGVPMETYKRKVRIFSPARSAGQQGQGNTIFSKARPWRIAFDTQQKWINPLMGWTSTADPLENVSRSALQFYTKEEAVEFARKHGWEGTVEDPQQRNPIRQTRFAGYGDNFSVKRAGIPDLSTLPSNRTAAKPASKPASK
eukprot:GHRQ01004077.1.p1 GENE.GHRQ01004077.1~~GHRQ01004077.1.p1  ORF type:complete len:194 (+),score=76.85 GHRQ01004077.1:195-776(+)